MKKVLLVVLAVVIMLSLCGCNKMDGIQKVFCGAAHSGALDEDGNLWLWGDNFFGQLANGKKTTIKDDVTVVENNDAYSPVLTFENVKDAALGNGFTLVLFDDGRLVSYGRNDMSQLGRKDDDDECILTDVMHVSTCTHTSAAVTSNGDLYVWGKSIAGYDGEVETVDTPTVVAKNAVSVSVGGSHLAYFDNDGKLWGLGYLANLGPGYETVNEFVTEPMLISENAKYVSCGSQTTFYIDEADVLWGTGANGFSGSVGDGSGEWWIYDYREVARDVKEVYGNAAMYLSNDGMLYAWDELSDTIKFRDENGEETGGQVGEDPIATYGPTPIEFLGGMKNAAGGGSHSIAVDEDGYVYTWGLNTFGRLGNGKCTVLERKLLFDDGEYTQYEYNKTADEDVKEPLKIR
ncbi:MAG: hypothetical protein II982_01350 [Clostridia bacterium]|nr:hypothetical protein [Clostridia bacterium]